MEEEEPGENIVDGKSIQVFSNDEAKAGLLHYWGCVFFVCIFNAGLQASVYLFMYFHN